MSYILLSPIRFGTEDIQTQLLRVFKCTVDQRTLVVGTLMLILTGWLQLVGTKVLR